MIGSERMSTACCHGGAIDDHHDGDVGDADVMAKLVLSCELVKEAVEVGVS